MPEPTAVELPFIIMLSGALFRIGWIAGFHIMHVFRLAEPVSKVTVEGAVGPIHLGEKWAPADSREVH